MARARVAVVLGAIAVLALLGTGLLAATTYDGDHSPAEPLEVVDSVSGASLTVPGDGWEVQDDGDRIAYDSADLDRVVVWAPALFRGGYCAADPTGSFRALAGFTRQPFEDWDAVLAAQHDVLLALPGWQDEESVVLHDGTAATLRRAAFAAGHGRCAATETLLAMVSAGGVNAIVVADGGDDGTLSRKQVRDILMTLELP